MYIDLASFLNPSPYLVPEDMSLAKVTSFACLYLFMMHLLSIQSHCALMAL
uniref:Chloride channel protein n=1 Tax=Rhizophora mucronata TaxID=61149 RepID=A0A2P2MKZ8_RHIMU